MMSPTDVKVARGHSVCVPWLQNLIFWSSLEAEDCGSKPVHIMYLTKARKLEFCSKILRKQTNREIKCTPNSWLFLSSNAGKKYKK